MNEIDELKAHIELLRKSIAFNAVDLLPAKWKQKPWAKQLLEKTPAQSLNHIRAQVEEETIERCVEIIDDCDPNLTIWELRQLINNQKRKYKEPSDGD